MKITTLNLAGYKNWDERKDRITDYLTKANPDAVFFQEVMFDHAISPYNQAALINANLTEPYRYSHTSISEYYQPSHGEPYREGLAMLSRYPISNSEVLVLTKQPNDKHSRYIQTVSIEMDGQRHDFTNVHFSNNRYSVGQLKETLSILNSRGVRSVVLGDFNIFDLESEQHLFSPDYTSSTSIGRYVSFPSENATLDYMLVPKEMKLLSIEIAEGLSDHNAVTAELGI